jgi:hypothetical protein
MAADLRGDLLGAAPDVNRRWFSSPEGIGALWIGVLAGPVAWALDLTVSYAIVQWTCGGGPRIVLHLISLAALAIVAAGAMMSWRALAAAAPGQREDGSHPEERGRFMAVLGLVMCAMFALVVVAAAIPRLVLDACHQ